MTFASRSVLTLLAGAALASYPVFATDAHGAAQRANPIERSFPGDTLTPSTPLRQFPSETFSQTQMGALEAMGIETAADFVNADARVIARAMNVRPREVERLQQQMCCDGRHTPRSRAWARAGVDDGSAERAFPGDTLTPSDRAFPGDTLTPSERAFPGDTLTPSERAFPGDTLTPSESGRQIPGDTFRPATPLRAFPTHFISPDELQALDRLQIETAQDLVEANPGVIARTLDMSPREARRFQSALRERMEP
jgi:hypothetical protein